MTIIYNTGWELQQSPDRAISLDENIMEDVLNKIRPLLCFLTILTLTLFLRPPQAQAVGIDLLGDIAQPIIGPTKDKLKNAMVYIWLQPYAGYAFGTSDQTRIQPSGAVTAAPGLNTEGFFYGGRGGLLLFDTFRIGLDYSTQSLKRDSLVENASGAFVKQPVSGKSTMLGALLGFDIPYTPFKGLVTRYFKASVGGDSAVDGEGWGGGVSFLLKNPFLISVEKRKLKYSAVALNGKRADASIDQYFLSLSFMLF